MVKGLKIIEQRKKIIDFMYSRGCDIEEIAETIQLSNKTVKRHLENLGYEVSKSLGNKLTDEELEEIKVLINQGLSVEEIANQIYRNKKTIRKYLRVMGLKAKRKKRNKL